MLKSWAKNYSIFLRKICVGKEDGFFLPLPRAFPATCVVFLRLLIVISSTGLATGDISLISTGGGDQELSFSVFLKERYPQVGAGTAQHSAERWGLRAGKVKVSTPQPFPVCADILIHGRVRYYCAMSYSIVSSQEESQQARELKKFQCSVREVGG